MVESKASDTETCYVYAIRDPVTKVPVYIGYTSNPKIRMISHLYSRRLPGLKAWVDSLRDSRPVMDILYTETTRAAAATREREVIREFLSHGCDLLNVQTYPVSTDETPDPWCEDDIAALSEFIRKCRTSRVRKVESARILGSSYCTIYRWIKGVTRPAHHELVRAELMKRGCYDFQPRNNAKKPS